MIEIPQCFGCAHYIEVERKDKDSNRKKPPFIYKCKAFPNQIPDAAFWEHSKKIEGQQGDYVFKPIKEDGQD